MEKTTFNHIMSIDVAYLPTRGHSTTSLMETGWIEQSQSYLRKQVIRDFFS